MKIVFSGTIGRSGLGGQAWANLQYLLGFRELGHDVWYLEDCGDTTHVWDWERKEWDYGLDYPSHFIRSCLAPFGFGERWIYRTDAGSRGMPLDTFQEICRGADLLVLRAVPLWSWREEYDWPCKRAFIDVDPGFTQIAIANQDRDVADGIARCERRFTIAQRIGMADCLIPPNGGPWLKTVLPIFLPEWPVVELPGTHLTSIVRWRGLREANHSKKTFGQRDREFPKFFELPRLTSQKFRIALMGINPEELTKYGWEIASGEVISRTPGAYREFIQSSRGEFGVPKQGYIQMRGGWFSDRSVCYLASGRPVIVEDTGLGDWLPVGRGLLTFCDLESARAAVEELNVDYGRHCRAARDLAEKHFATNRVLPEFLEAAMS